MQGAARLFFTLAIIYAILGMILGLAMAISKDHGEVVTHAHIMLAGWVSSALIAYFYHLFPMTGSKPIAIFHFWFQAASSVLMLGSLFLLYGGNPAVEPGAAVGSIGFALGMLLFAYIALPVVWKS
ncbi:MAG: hypothetical protein ABIN69_18140 [Aestuariivirga sp.]